MSPTTAVPKAQEKKIVDGYFHAGSSNWNALYEGKDVFAVIHQERRSMALQYFDELSLPKESRVLEVGCGAGLLTVDLAQRGYTIKALDRVKAMVDLTRRNSLKAGVQNRVNPHIGDVYQLPFRDGIFNCLIALGVTPYVLEIESALKEIARVLTPRGHVIINADNRYRLNHLFDPALMPALASLKGELKRTLEKSGLRKPLNEPHPHMYTRKEFNQLLTSAGLVPVKHQTLGFGPFSFLKWQFLGDTLGVKLHHDLQRYSNRGLKFLQFTGAQFLVIARKS